MYDEEYRTKDEVGYSPSFIKGNYCQKYDDDPGKNVEAGWKLKTLSECCQKNFQVSSMPF